MICPLDHLFVCTPPLYFGSEFRVLITHAFYGWCLGLCDAIVCCVDGVPEWDPVPGSVRGGPW